MRTFIWDVNSVTQVKLTASAFGKLIVYLNEIKVTTKRNYLFGKTLNFELENGDQGEISFSNSSGFSPSAVLKINGEEIIESDPELVRNCSECHKESNINDKFCQHCGAELPDAHLIVGTKHIKEARNAILILAVMFSLFGTFMFFIQKGTYDKALTEISHMSDQDDYPQYINGQKFTVGEIRTQITIEKYSILGLNYFLALIMLGLSFWAKTAPLGAIIVATAVYASIQILNAIVDPQTIAQGLILKIIIISLLVKGIKAGLAQRAANAK